MKHLAYIEEASCVGCTKCIAVCPVDAIVGAEQWTHTVIQAICIGCELCVPACPVDCIRLIPPPQSFKALPQVAIQKRVANRKKRLSAEQEKLLALSLQDADKKRYLDAVRTRKRQDG